MVKDFNQDMDDEKMSRINSAGIINITIENLWRESYSAMARGDYSLWNIKLDSLWAILGGDVKDESKEDKKFNAINVKIYESGSIKNKVGSGFEAKENPNNPLKYQLLLKKALFLRRLQNSQGKGTAYISDDEDDFD